MQAPALPALPTKGKPLPQDFLEQVFQDTSVDAYRNASLAYPAKKAKGSDLWEARLIGALPDQVLFFMLVCLRLAQWRGRWPSWFTVLYMAMLPKPDGGTRCVAKSLMQYRMWGCIRKPLRLRWEASEVEEWDLCRPGRSALDAAFERSLDCEVAVRTGQHCGAILWDFEKFFDTVPVDILLNNALAAGFPVIDLILGLSMHGGVRYLQAMGCLSAACKPFRSILAGCMLAISFTKALFKHPLGKLHTACQKDKVKQSIYVDDFGQHVVGTLHEVGLNLSIAAARFVKIAKDLKLSLSASKPVAILASHPLIQEMVALKLRGLKVPCQMVSAHRDLGVQLSLNKTRRTGILMSRLKQAKKRLRVTSRLVKIDRAAR